jgi:hypothetical protein
MVIRALVVGDTFAHVVALFDIATWEYTESEIYP